MFRRTDPADWMFAHACDLLAQADALHRQFFRLAASTRTQALWEPPADVLEDDREVLIVVAMPGVAAERVEVRREPGVLVVRAQRRPTPGGSRHVVRQLEIPYGTFERRIALPDMPLEADAPQMTHGCLIVRMRKISVEGRR